MRAAPPAGEASDYKKWLQVGHALHALDGAMSDYEDLAKPLQRSSVNSFKMLELLMQRLKPLLWWAAVKGARSTWKSSGG